MGIKLINRFQENVLLTFCIQGVPKKEDESITPLFIGRF
jgi:hypothetical protein